MQALSKEGYCNCRGDGMIQNRVLADGMIQNSVLADGMVGNRVIAYQQAA